jgi:methionyl-tRNA formyltransferase
MRMELGLDTGPMLLKKTIPIAPGMTGGALHDALAPLGAASIVEALAKLDTLVPEKQGDGATYAKKLGKDEARLDWTQDAAALERRVRAFDPFPGAWFAHAGERFKVLGARVAAAAPPGKAGTLVAAPLVVACGTGALELTRVQRAGRATMDADALLRGFALPVGTVLA